MTPTTPVRPIPVTTSSQPKARSLSATSALVRWVSKRISGWAWMSRRQSEMAGARSAKRLTTGTGLSPSGGEALDEAAHEGSAGIELIGGDEFVGLVGLGDRARAADHRREAGGLEVAGLGLVGDDGGGRCRRSAPGRGPRPRRRRGSPAVPCGARRRSRRRDGSPASPPSAARPRRRGGGASRPGSGRAGSGPRRRRRSRGR